MEITIKKLGESKTVLEVPAGTTVSDALDKMNWTSDGYKMMIGDRVVNDNAELRDGDVLTMSPKVEAGI